MTQVRKIRIVYRQKLYKFLNEKFCRIFRDSLLQTLNNLDEDDRIFFPFDFTVTVHKGTKKMKNQEVLFELRFEFK